MLKFNGRDVTEVVIKYNKFADDEFNNNDKFNISINVENGFTIINYVNCNKNGFDHQYISNNEIRCINIKT